MLVARLSAFLLDHLLMALLLFFSRELGLVSFLAALKLPSLVLYWGLYLSFYIAYSYICQSVFKRTLGKIVLGLVWERPNQKQLLKRLIYKLFLLNFPLLLVCIEKGFFLILIPYYAFLFVSYYQLLFLSYPLYPDKWAKQKLISTNPIWRKKP